MSRRNLAQGAGIFTLFLVLTTVLQWSNGAFYSEFAGDADEPSHYVTGLMVRDYLAQLAPAPPMEYAEAYYIHYPRVAMGHWPPMFYAVEGVWYTPREDFAYDESGIASWYGPGFHARRTANGDVFDQNALTAAHPTLQMPAKVAPT